MAHRAAAPLQEAALDRKARIVEIEERHHLAHRFAIEQFRIDAVDPHGIAAPGKGIALRIGMEEIEHAALRHHGVEIEILLEPLPQFHRPFVERIVAGQHVVGADDRGVAPDIAGAEPAFFQHRDIGDAVHLGEVIGGRKPMPATADDDDVIFLLGLRLAPRRRPVLVAGERILEE